MQVTTLTQPAKASNATARRRVTTYYCWAEGGDAAVAQVGNCHGVPLPPLLDMAPPPLEYGAFPSLTVTHLDAWRRACAGVQLLEAVQAMQAAAAKGVGAHIQEARARESAPADDAGRGAL